MTLSPEQQCAVEYIDGPQLVIAGAGSGKTRVLTHKIAYLLEQGMAPWNILALTFTNKAAREMKERVAALVGEERARGLMMGTFHSVFARILRQEAQFIGRTSQFTIYDQADQRALIKSLVKAMALPDDSYKPPLVGNILSLAKNHLVTPAAFDTSPFASDHLIALSQLYTAYEKRCESANALDFDDLLLLTYQLFSNHEDIRQHWASRFHYVLVDEYQDTNRAQQAILRQLTAERQKLCAVGDDAQSIYSFRGASIAGILNFEQLWPGAQLHKLTSNYRSTKNIVAAADSLIAFNKHQIAKKSFAPGERGDKVQLWDAESDREEAALVARTIQRSGTGQTAILYRTNAQSRLFEEQLRSHGISYHVYGGLAFYQRSEIKDVVSYLRLVVNPDDDEALARIINRPARGIGATTMARVTAEALARGTSLWSVLTNGDYQAGRAATKIAAFCQMVQRWAEARTTTDAATLTRTMLTESGLTTELYSSQDPEYVSKQENVEEMLAAVAQFVSDARDQGTEPTLENYLQEVALMTTLDEAEGEEPQVALMTIHAAKGLEFPTVYVVGLEENLLPPQQAFGDEVEEERRLLYVAITRAQKLCILTYARSRYRYGYEEYTRPSRFLSEIDPATIAGRAEPLHQWELQNARKNFFQPSKPQPSKPQPADSGRKLTPLLTHKLKTPAPAGPSPFAVGQTVEHVRFGRGTVMAIEGTGADAKATVNFQSVGVKQLLLRFAKLSKV